MSTMARPKASRRKPKPKADPSRLSDVCDKNENGLSEKLETLSLNNGNGIDLNGGGDHHLDLTSNSSSYSDEGYKTMTSGLSETAAEARGEAEVLIPKIVKVVSLAPTAEQEEFDDEKESEQQQQHSRNVPDHTVVFIGDSEEPEESILGLSYPNHQQFYDLAENAGHFLAGGAGLDSLSYSTESGPGSFDGGHAQPALASCSTIWDGVINLCEIENCSKPAVKKCSSCKRAFYCGEDHQKVHWKKHKHECVPYKLEHLRGTAGADGVPISAMVASRNIPPGQEVFSEKPFLIFPLVSDADLEHPMDCPGLLNPGFCQGGRKPACFGCMKAVEFIGPSRYQCSTCRLPLCSDNCEFGSPQHQLGECNAISNCGIMSEEESLQTCYHALYMDVEILRALQLGAYDSPAWEKFLELKQNIRVDIYKQTPRFKRFFRNIVKLVPYSAKISGYNFDLIGDVHATITACSFRPALRTTYKLLFSTQLLILHDCTPNTVYYVEDEKTADQHKMRLVTKAAIPIAKGEVITFDFLPTPYLPYPYRRTILNNLCIDCNCMRCIRPFEARDFTADVKCAQCRDGYVCAEQTPHWEEAIWSCRNCQEEVSFTFINKIEYGFQLELATIPKTRAGINQLVHLIKRASHELNPGHGLVIAAWCFIESILRNKLSSIREPDCFKLYDQETYRDFGLITSYCDVVEPHLNSIRNGLWVDKGILLFHKFYSAFVLTSKEYRESQIDKKTFTRKIFQCLKILQEALQILTVFEGMNSSKYIGLLTQEATGALATLKDFAARLITQPEPAPPAQPYFTFSTMSNVTKTHDTITGSLPSTSL